MGILLHSSYKVRSLNLFVNLFLVEYVTVVECYYFLQFITKRGWKANVWERYTNMLRILKSIKHSRIVQDCLVTGKESF